MHIGSLAWPAWIILILLVWLVFGILWWAPLIFLEGYNALGGVFPTPTAWVIGAARNGVPLACAVLYTVVLGWLFFRPGRHAAWLIAAMLGFAALWAAVALAAMAIPLQVCGFHWPDPPWADGTSSVAARCRLPD